MEIYVIGPRSGPRKIGLAANPRKRMNTLQTGHSGKIDLLYSRAVPVECASDIERRVHWVLRDKRGVGEWFTVSLEEAKQAIEEASLTRGEGEKGKHAVGRPPLNAKSATKPVLVRLTEAQAERIDVLAGPNKRAEFIREAVDREISRRSRIPKPD